MSNITVADQTAKKTEKLTSILVKNTTSPEEKNNDVQLELHTHLRRQP